MDKTLHQLGELLITALPTFLIVIFLNYYLKFTFIKPMEKILGERDAATTGARKAAEQSMAKAEAKAAEFEAALREQRFALYQAQEKANKELQEQMAAQVAEERKKAEAAIASAKTEIESEVAAAKVSLQRDSEILANQIVESILRGQAA
jgi:F0F1-type ATP synthase membrane subunit b/b'